MRKILIIGTFFAVGLFMMNVAFANKDSKRPKAISMQSASSSQNDDENENEGQRN